MRFPGTGVESRGYEKQYRRICLRYSRARVAGIQMQRRTCRKVLRDETISLLLINGAVGRRVDLVFPTEAAKSVSTDESDFST